MIEELKLKKKKKKKKQPAFRYPKRRSRTKLIK